MRYLITLVSVVSLVFVTPFAFAATTETATPKPTAEAFTLPGMGMMDDDMMDDADMDAMMQMMNMDDKDFRNMMSKRAGMMMPGFPMHGFSDFSSPWGILFSTINMALIWIRLVSIICALWAWIKKQK